MTQLLLRASCATAPPQGQECHDTVAYGPIPDAVWLSVLATIAVVVVVIVLVARTQRRR